jgi:UDP-N-acetylglucosamine 1-carboxyvinyltransferase
VRRLRASFLLLGPLMARHGSSQLPLPGGCPIGVRPVDLHLKGLRALGAELSSQGGSWGARAERLHPAEIHLDYPSVGATEQIMMTAALIPGRTVISNPAQDPEVHDLARLLIKMGAGIMIEPGRLQVEGAKKLSGAVHTVIPIASMRGRSSSRERSRAGRDRHSLSAVTFRSAPKQIR